MALDTEALKGLNPKERLKRLKELEEQQKKDLKRIKALVSESKEELKQPVKENRLEVELSGISADPKNLESQVKEAPKKEEKHVAELYEKIKNIYEAYQKGETGPDKSIFQLYQEINAEQERLEGYSTVSESFEQMASVSKRMLMNMMSGYLPHEEDYKHGY